MKPKEYLLLIILASINFTHIMDFMIMMPLGAYLMPLFDISPQQFSFLVSSYTFSAAIIGFSAAFFVDRFDRKKVLLTGYIGFVAGTFLCAFAPSYILLLFARIIAGGFGGLIGAQVLSIVGDAIPFERRGQAMGLMMGAFSFAAAIGVPTGLFLASNLGWQAPFLMIAGAGSIVIPLVIFFVPAMNGHIQNKESRPNPVAVFTNIFTNTNQKRALLLMFVLMFGHFITIPFLAPYLEFNLEFDKNTVTLMYFIGGSVSMFSSQIVGRFADKYGHVRVFGIMALLTTIPVFIITNLEPVAYYYVLIFTTFFFIFAGGRSVPVQAIMSSVVTPQQRGSFMSFSSSLQQLSTGSAALIAGFIVQKDAQEHLYNYNYVGYISIVLSVVCVFLAARVSVAK